MLKDLYPDLYLPPEPILTRWGTWLEAAQYYYENYNKIKNVLSHLEDEAVAINTAKSLFEKPNLRNDLAFISDNCVFLAQAITQLESQSVRLTENVSTVKKFIEKVEGIPGSIKYKRFTPTGVEKKYVCPVCGRSYGYKKNLVSHQKYACGTEPTFLCNLCNYRGRHKAALKVHMFNHHHINKLDPLVTAQYQCVTCGRCYNHRAGLWRHQKYECGILPQFPCPYCPYAGKRKEHIRRHVQMRHNSDLKE
uniref:C2H2-type domain-containing protein n=1 Tax=Rhodnius prolixus TaxID=13249 RepID=T1HQ16_RHOPR